MTTRDQPRFDVEALKAIAGETTFARGDAYHRSSLVSLLSIEPARVLAQVEGTEDYRTELMGRGRKIDGSCSCPAFADRGFCKHMVAVALAANAVGGDAEVEGVGALERIREHLKAKGVDALVEMIMDLAERDPALFRKLDMAASVAQGDDKTVETRLRKAIDGATRTGSFVDYREAESWASGVEEALDAVADLVPAGRAAVALKLAERAIDRIERAIEHIDDSDGHCTMLLHHAGEIHLAAASVIRPVPVQLARDLFARETGKDNYDTFSGAAAAYADILGEKGLKEYRRLASAAWEKLPSRTGKTREDRGFFDDYRLKSILDFFAERDGDVDARIALRTKDLSSQWSYLELAEFCLSQGREDEALRRAEEGLWMFEDERPDERLVFFVVNLLAKTGRDNEAETHLWRAFQKQPNLELYKRLSNLGEAARSRALAFLETRLSKEQSTRWHFPADQFIRVLMYEELFAKAWQAVRKHGASMGLKESLARASEATHPREALETYTERVDQLVGSGGNNPAYEAAVKLVARMGALRNAKEQGAYIETLKVRFGRKRNFMKLLG